MIITQIKIDELEFTTLVKMATRVIKLKKLVQSIVQPVLGSVQPVQPVQPVKRLIKLKNPEALQPEPHRRLIKISNLPVPPIPAVGIYLTKAMEAFESIREYYSERGLHIPQSEIKWYYAELKQEKEEFDTFWARCASTKACIDGTLRGDDDWTITLAMNAARQLEKKMPILETDIGPMPDYGTVEFWAWCHKRKKLKEQEDAAIIAAGGVVEEKSKKKKV